VKMPADFARVGAKLVGQRVESELGHARHELQHAPAEHVRAATHAIDCTAAQPVNALPELGSELLGAGKIDYRRGAIEQAVDLVRSEPNVKRHHWLASHPEHGRRVRRVEADRIEVQVRRRVEQHVILACGEREQLPSREVHGAVADPERRGSAHHEVQLGLAVEVPWPASARRLRVLPHEGALTVIREETLVQRSALVGHPFTLASPPRGATSRPFGTNLAPEVSPRNANRAVMPRSCFRLNVSAKATIDPPSRAVGMHPT